MRGFYPHPARAPFPWPEFCALATAAGFAAGTWFAVVALS